MPAKTERQRRAMYAAAAGKSTLGIPASVGAKFMHKGIPEHKTVMKPTPAKMKAYAKGMRQHIMNTGKKKKSYSTGGTTGGSSVGGGSM